MRTSSTLLSRHNLLIAAIILSFSCFFWYIRAFLFSATPNSIIVILQYDILASHCLRTIYYVFRRHNSCINWIQFSLYNMFRPFRPSSSGKLYYISTLLSCYYSPILANVYNFLKGKVICVIYSVNAGYNLYTSLNIRLKLILILNKIIKWTNNYYCYQLEFVFFLPCL
jgi:hypothetical protein